MNHHTERTKYRVSLRSDDGRKVEHVVYATSPEHAIKKARKKSGHWEWSASAVREGETPAAGTPDVSLS